jgi:hypothetical protein
VNKAILAGLVLVVIVSISAVWFLEGYSSKHSGLGFGIYSLGDNSLLLSDADILSYNWTSQEITITAQASQRLNRTQDLYSWTGFVIKIDGEETYKGVFREATMNAIPAPPKISVIFPSVDLATMSTNYGAVRMFFPSFQPPSDQPGNNAKVLNYFERVNKLVY